MRLVNVWLSTLVLLSLFISSARAELTIEITQGVDQPTPVAVVPFAWSGNALPEDVAQIVNNDLGRTGLFKMIARESMLSVPSKQSEIYFRDWRVLATDFVLIGRMSTQANGEIKVEFELYDVLKEQQLMSEQVSAPVRSLRDIAHYISDKVYEKLTGLRGAFSTRIAYVTAQRLGHQRYSYKLMLSDADGARPRVILKSNEPILSPAWSRDGKQLAYVSFETTRPAIYIQELASGKRQRVQSFKGLNGAPAWSPNGDKLALVLSKDGNPEVYVLDMQRRQLNRITHHYGIDTEPSWSPDGQSLIFTSDRGGQPQIYRIHLPSRELVRLTFEGQQNQRGRLTHDGRFLAMVHQSNGRFHIAVQDLKTGRLDILTDTQLDESPTIAPNGSIILYATQEGTRGVLGGVSLDGRVKFRLPAAIGDVREPAWSPYLQ